MWKRLAILAACAIGRDAHQVAGAGLSFFSDGEEFYKEAAKSNDVIEIGEPEDDGPELVDEEGDLWPVAVQHAQGALLAINTERNAAELSVLSNMAVQHAYHLMIGSKQGFRICLSVEEDGATTYVEIDTESREMEQTFEAIFNIMPLDVLGSAMASTFANKNNNDLLSQYPVSRATCCMTASASERNF